MEVSLKDLKELLGCGASESPSTDGMYEGLKILILQRGWVVVGNCKTTGSTVEVTNAHVIRIWGTTNGLGEIAEGGPTDKTKLDKAGTMRTHVLAVVASLDCEVSKWNL